MVCLGNRAFIFPFFFVVVVVENKNQKSYLFPTEAIESYALTEEALEWFAALTGQKSAAPISAESSPLQIIESWLGSHAGKYLTGKSLTIADLAVSTYLAVNQQSDSLGARGKVGCIQSEKLGVLAQ